MTEGPSRRAALRVLAGWSGCAAAAGIAPLVSCVRQTAPSPRDLTPLVKLADLPDGAGLRTQIRGEPILVVNHGGVVRALSGLCTHEGCELGWNGEQRLIRCPCHGSAFDPSGRVV